MPTSSTTLTAQLASALKSYADLKAKATHDDLSGNIDDKDVWRVQTELITAIQAIGGRNSTYAQQMERVLSYKGDWAGKHVILLAGIAESLNAAVNAGYLRTAAELVHGEVFGDFLEIADHLLSEGYKDPAAVIAGAALEAHHRQLCGKHSVPIEVNKGSGPVPKKADAMNSDLAGATVYSKLDQKCVTAWLDLRNKAAHGKFNEYTKEQVVLQITGIRDFVVRCPA